MLLKDVMRDNRMVIVFGDDSVLHSFGRRMILLTPASDIRRVFTLRPSEVNRGLEPVSW